MTPQERERLASIATLLLAISTLRWAGAKAAAQGMRLFRDGAVAGVRIGEVLEGNVLDGELPERVVLGLRDGDLVADCSCGSAPCAHAVALVHDLQKRARAAQDSHIRQQGVLAALKDRMQGASRAHQQGIQILSDMERLPLQAAVDMVALNWRQSLRQTPPELQQLLNLAERIRTGYADDPVQMAELAQRIVAAISHKKPIFTTLAGEAETAVRILAPLCCGALTPALADPTQIQAIVRLTLHGHPQAAPVLAAGLEALARRDAEACVKIVGWSIQSLRESDQRWRETTPPGATDVLLSGLCLACLDHDLPSEALDSALAWPPMRNALQMLASRLAADDRSDDLMRVIGHYDPRGDLWAAGVEAAVPAAAMAGHPGLAAQLLRWALQYQATPNLYDVWRQHAPPQIWPKLRDEWVQAALAHQEIPWLAEKLAADTDGAKALFHAVQLAPTRDPTVLPCLRQLQAIEPLLAWHARSLRLRAVLGVPGQTARSLKDELTPMASLAQQLGESQLLTDFCQLLVAEGASGASLNQAIAVVVGKLA